MGDPESEVVRWLRDGAPVSAHLADAFTRFPAYKAKLGNCVSPSSDSMHVYVFLALFFGHKSVSFTGQDSSVLVLVGGGPALPVRRRLLHYAARLQSEKDTELVPGSLDAGCAWHPDVLR